MREVGSSRWKWQLRIIEASINIFFISSPLVAILHMGVLLDLELNDQQL